MSTGTTIDDNIDRDELEIVSSEGLSIEELNRIVGDSSPIHVRMLARLKKLSSIATVRTKTFEPVLIYKHGETYTELSSDSYGVITAFIPNDNTEDGLNSIPVEITGVVYNPGVGEDIVSYDSFFTQGLGVSVNIPGFRWSFPWSSNQIAGRSGFDRRMFVGDLDISRCTDTGESLYAATQALSFRNHVNQDICSHIVPGRLSLCGQLRALPAPDSQFGVSFRGGSFHYKIMSHAPTYATKTRPIFFDKTVMLAMNYQYDLSPRIENDVWEDVSEFLRFTLDPTVYEDTFTPEAFYKGYAQLNIRDPSTISTIPFKDMYCQLEPISGGHAIFFYNKRDGLSDQKLTCDDFWNIVSGIPVGSAVLSLNFSIEFFLRISNVPTIQSNAAAVSKTGSTLVSVITQENSSVGVNEAGNLIRFFRSRGGTLVPIQNNEVDPLASIYFSCLGRMPKAALEMTFQESSVEV